MPATFNKFNCFVQDLGRGIHNLNSDQLYVMLSATLPVNTNTVYSNLADLTTAGGYTAGGALVAGNTFIQTGGIATLTATDLVFTASGGTIGPFRYVALYNHTASAKNLIGWWDYGSSTTLNNTETLTVELSTGILSLQ